MKFLVTTDRSKFTKDGYDKTDDSDAELES